MIRRCNGRNDEVFLRVIECFWVQATNSNGGVPSFWVGMEHSKTTIFKSRGTESQVVHLQVSSQNCWGVSEGNIGIKKFVYMIYIYVYIRQSIKLKSLDGVSNSMLLSCKSCGKWGRCRGTWFSTQLLWNSPLPPQKSKNYPASQIKDVRPSGQSWSSNLRAPPFLSLSYFWTTNFLLYLFQQIVWVGALGFYCRGFFPK